MRFINAALYYTVFVFCFFLSSIPLFADLIEGDAGKNALESFAFPIKPHIVGPNSFYVGAAPVGGVPNTKEYALSVLLSGQSKFLPLTFESTTLNGKSGPNPLFDKQIEHLALIQLTDTRGVRPFHSQHPVIVTANDPLTIYAFNSFLDRSVTQEKISLVSATNIKDAVNANTSGIEGIAAGANCVFAAVKPNAGGIFGDPGSGIAMLVYGDLLVGDGEKQKIQKALTYLNTAALDKGSAVVKMAGGGNAATLLLKDMYWDSTLERLYIALEVTTGGGGARALVVGYIKNNRLILAPIAPDGVFGAANDEIVGTGQGGAVVSLNKVRTMHTSTWLHYVIVLGGNVALVPGPLTIQRKVFALPLVNNPMNLNHGTLAKFDSAPEDFFTGDPNEHAAFNNRFFKTAASQNGHILKAADAKAMVGGGDAPGDITDMLVLGDAVYVAVDVPFNGGVTKRRIYVSRALFDNQGRVKDWTEWKPVRSTIGRVEGFGFDATFGNLISMESDNGAADQVKSVRRTAWGSGDQAGLGDLVTVLGGEFPQPTGGIHGLFDFSENYLGVSDAAFLIATGLKKVALIETGRIVPPNPMRVNKGNFSANHVSFDGGTVTQNLGGALRVAVIGGGVLNDIGPIESAEIAFESVNNTSRIFVGGPGGLAALVNPNGSGIANPGLQAGFGGIVVGMEFTKIGDYKFVRKLVADRNFLYVLTDKKLDKIDLRNNDFNATTIATLESVGVPAGGSFLDLVVSGKLGVLATSVGVFRTANGNDIEVAGALADLGWTKLEIPEVNGPALELIALNKNNLSQGLVNGGNLYVLSSYSGKNRAKWSRFEVKDVSGIAVVDDNTFMPLPDIFAQTVQEGKIKSYFANFGSFRKLLTTDGAIRFAARDRDQELSPVLTLLSSRMFSGHRFASVGFRSIDVGQEGASDIIRVVRSGGSGDILVGLDAGLRVNE